MSPTDAALERLEAKAREANRKLREAKAAQAKKLADEENRLYNALGKAVAASQHGGDSSDPGARVEQAFASLGLEPPVVKRHGGRRAKPAQSSEPAAAPAPEHRSEQYTGEQVQQPFGQQG